MTANYIFEVEFQRSCAMEVLTGTHPTSTERKGQVLGPEPGPVAQPMNEEENEQILHL
jgi:hypothetical protein